MKIIAVVSVLISLVVVGFGALSLSQATSGVGIIAIGCYLAILARMFQASSYADEAESAAQNIVASLRKLDTPTDLTQK